jgi:hypothetical protein
LRKGGGKGRDVEDVYGQDQDEEDEDGISDDNDDQGWVYVYPSSAIELSLPTRIQAPPLALMHSNGLTSSSGDGVKVRRVMKKLTVLPIVIREHPRAVWPLSVPEFGAAHAAVSRWRCWRMGRSSSWRMGCCIYI